MWDSGDCVATADWTDITRSFSHYGNNLRSITFAFSGRDRENWAGHFGTRFGNPGVFVCVPPSIQARAPAAFPRIRTLASRPMIASLPLYSSFCEGRGEAYYINGGRVSDRSWCNIRYQVHFYYYYYYFPHLLLLSLEPPSSCPIR